MKTRIGRLHGWNASRYCLCLFVFLFLQIACLAQVNTGSDGSDGAFNPKASTNIDMTVRPNGIYQYTSVSIPSGVTVTFTPNINNTPVVWLVQGNVVISGTVDVSGQNSYVSQYGGVGAPGAGGPGGYRGGNLGENATSGQGPGGGGVGVGTVLGGNASYGTSGLSADTVASPGSVYGNNFLIPLLGGSGGGGCTGAAIGGRGYPEVGGAGGGGAILIASSSTIQLSGLISAYGGAVPATYTTNAVACGSGGAVRLVAVTITGNGSIGTAGGNPGSGGGSGRVRFDCYVNSFGGTVNNAVFTHGSQFVVVPMTGSGAQLTITSVSGVAVSASPGGLIPTPDVVISAQQPNPISITVQCLNIPLHTPITVTVTPTTGPVVTATGYNDAGTLASSTATISITTPRGGGLISASAATGG